MPGQIEVQDHGGKREWEQRINSLCASHIYAEVVTGLVAPRMCLMTLPTVSIPEDYDRDEGSIDVVGSCRLNRLQSGIQVVLRGRWLCRDLTETTCLTLFFF